MATVNTHTSSQFLDQAAGLAEHLGARLAVVHVDPTHGIFGTRSDSSLLILQIDPDLPDDFHQPVLAEIRAHVNDQLSARSLRWTVMRHRRQPRHRHARIGEA